MQYMLMDYVQVEGFFKLTQDEQDHWLGAYRAYLEAMRNAGVYKSGNGLHPASMATTVRVANGKTQVLDGPYAETKEQLGGFGVLEARDLNHVIQLMSKHPGVKAGPCEIRPGEDLTEMIHESERRRSRTKDK